MPADSLVIVLAGGVGERLFPLTKERAKPAVLLRRPLPHHRLHAVSNCINSGLRRIFIATQYKSLSLNRHIRMGWSVVAEELGEFIEILPPQKRVGEHWYLGTADAVYQNLYSIMREDPRHLIVLSGDHIYKMDYARDAALPQRARRGGDDRRASRCRSEEATPVRRRRRSTTRTRVTGFHEKPREPIAVPGSPTSRWRRWASTSSRPTCSCTALEADAARDTNHDFGKDILPALIAEAPGRTPTASPTRTRRRRSTGATSARSTPTTRPTWTSCHVNPEFNLYDPEWPMRTWQVQAPPAKFVFADEGQRCGQALDSIISAGLHHLGQPRRGQHPLPERARAQLLRRRPAAS